MSLTDEDCTLLTELGCTVPANAPDLCACAKVWRFRIQQRLMKEALKPGGEIIRIGQVQKSRRDYMEALQNLLLFTFRICQLQAQDEGPVMFHTNLRRCGETGCGCGGARYVTRVL